MARVFRVKYWVVFALVVWVAGCALACRSRDGSGPAGSSHAPDTGTRTSERGAPTQPAPPVAARAKEPNLRRVMLVGDSITAGPGCFKKHLVARLQQAGMVGFLFVGQYADDCGGEVRHSAVSCARAEDFLAESFRLPACFGEQEFPGLRKLLELHQPDLLLVQLGVNDIWRGASHETVLERYGQLLEQSRRVLPHLAFVFAQIPRFEPDCRRRDLTEEAARLAERVPAWASSHHRSGSPVDSVDLWSKSRSDLSVTTDCVHPNEEGARLLGELWFQELRPILARFPPR